MILGILLKRYRMWREITVRELAKEIGVPIATLSRVENGKRCDSGTLLLLLLWMHQPAKAVDGPRVA